MSACWPAIIQNEEFNLCHEKLSRNRHRPKSYLNPRYPFELSSLVYCSECKSPMCGKSANGSTTKIPYYEHSWVLKKNAYVEERAFCTNPRRIHAKIIEGEVWKKVSALLSDSHFADRLLKKAQNDQSEDSSLNTEKELKTFLSNIKNKLETLAEHLTQIPKGLSPDPIFKQMQKIEGQKKIIEDQLAESR